MDFNELFSVNNDKSLITLIGKDTEPIRIDASQSISFVQLDTKFGQIRIHLTNTGGIQVSSPEGELKVVGTTNNQIVIDFVVEKPEVRTVGKPIESTYEGNHPIWSKRKEMKNGDNDEELGIKGIDWTMD